MFTTYYFASFSQEIVIIDPEAYGAHLFTKNKIIELYKNVSDNKIPMAESKRRIIRTQNKKLIQK